MKILVLILSFLFVANAKETSLSLIAVGDNLIHSKIIASGYNDANRSYDYTGLYAHFKDKIKNVDIKIINQETILIKDKKKISGYPAFGSPLEVGEAVRGAGFNIITHATNHAFDKGEEGVIDSSEFWSRFDDTMYVGISPDHNRSETIKIFKKNGIKVAFLNYTYGLNGYKTPKGKDYLVDLLDNEKKIASDIKFAKQNADFVVVLPHWGIEYSHKISKAQKTKAHFLANSGADLIIGTHSHVIQPLEFIIADDNRSVPCFYSLGNFISNQEDPARMLGAMADVKIVKDNNKTQIKTLSAVPLITHISPYSRDYSVHFLKQYPAILAHTHRLKRTLGEKQMNPQKLKELWNSIFSEFSVE